MPGFIWISVCSAEMAFKASGFQGKGKKGNINFRVGSQDIIDIISHSIEKFARSGKVGAKGRMSCKGTVGQDVEKGLY
ncbi:hypothetical protein EYZ11_006923 [Aspergillus tanneri]|uniref:Ecp2 effector protein-like domain-containing protein n=1 Tax=Aspergillus tanneri TaxID=1220188 RepID=A0A4S3JGQ4_9EURO|nr:hypothetical protein EYZ11_006923 [Aspergillus tanneri]